MPDYLTKETFLEGSGILENQYHKFGWLKSWGECKKLTIVKMPVNIKNKVIQIIPDFKKLFEI